MPKHFTFTQQIVTELLLCARHCSNIWEYHSEQNKQKFLPWGSLHARRGRQTNVNKYKSYQMIISPMEKNEQGRGKGV